jgi:hypothetical protein
MKKITKQKSEKSIEDQRHLSNNYKILAKDENKFAYTYEYEFGLLARGDSFMGRSLLAEYGRIDPRFRDKINGDPEERAKLTIVADSSSFQTY